MNKTEIANLVNFAFSCYPMIQEKDPQRVAEAWSVMLSDMPYELAKWSIMKVSATSKFFPSIAEIREAAMSRLPSLPTAEEAWEEVHKTIKSGSTVINLRYNNKQPEWSHKLIKKAVDAIGLMDIINSENISYDRAQFIKFYNSFRDRTNEDRQDKYLLALGKSQGLLSEGAVNE